MVTGINMADDNPRKNDDTTKIVQCKLINIRMKPNDDVSAPAKISFVVP
jgi:hypothetical protein